MYVCIYIVYTYNPVSHRNIHVLSAFWRREFQISYSQAKQRARWVLLLYVIRLSNSNNNAGRSSRLCVFSQCAAKTIQLRDAFPLAVAFVAEEKKKKKHRTIHWPRADRKSRRGVVNTFDLCAARDSVCDPRIRPCFKRNAQSNARFSSAKNPVYRFSLMAREDIWWGRRVYVSVVGSSWMREANNRCWAARGNERRRCLTLTTSVQSVSYLNF